MKQTQFCVRATALGIGLALVLQPQLAPADDVAATEQPAPIEDAASPASSPAPPPPTPPIAEPKHELSPRQLAAEHRRQRGLRFWDQQNYRAAREEFRLAYELTPHPLFLYNQAVVSTALGESAVAYDCFQRYLLEAGPAIPPERRESVQRQLSDLAEHVAFASIRVDIQGALISIDGQPAGTSPLARTLSLEPGKHVVTVRSAGRREESRDIILVAGQSTVMVFSLLAAERNRERSASHTRWLVAGWTTTTILAAGAVGAGMKAVAAQSDYEKELRTVDSARADLNRLETKTLRWSIAADALTTAAVLAGAGSLWLTIRGPDSTQEPGHGRSVRLDITSSSASLAGTF